jgi:lysozyme
VNNVIDLVKQHEGCKLKPYVDTVGKTTIGVGRNLTDIGISQAEADFMLANDLEACKADLEKFWWFAPLDDVRKAVLMDLRFNLGLVGLLHFPHFLSAIGKQDWPTAKAELLDSTWAGQVGHRAIEDAQMIETGQWQT